MAHIINGCSPKNTSSANDSQNPKHPKISPQRRQSQRLSAINAMYKMADIMSSEIQQTSLENSPFSSKEIKFESLETLDDPSIAETLMDMRKRFKAKKRISLDSFGSANADLDEPLICLKSKKSDKSSASRKRRKCLLFEESSQVEEISGSSPIELDRSSFLKEVASEAESVITAGELANVETTNDVPTFSHVDFIAKYSSAELHEGNDGSEPETEDFTIFTADHLDCCVNEISVEFMESGSCKDPSETTELMSDVFGRARNFDLTRNHLQTLDSSQECNLGDSNEISPEKVVDLMLNDHVEKTAEIDGAEFVNSDIEKSLFEKTCQLSIPAAEKKSNLAEGEKSDQGIEYHPKKLLTSRKDLSPISQEKLRRALSSSELDDSMKTANNDEAEMMLSPEKSKGWVSKRVLKSPNTPDRNCACKKNSLIHTQAEKAVTFSQRQMQDIETIATKLLKGLASMRNIVVENASSEECLSTSSKISPEEVNIAIENASNLEATTKKWLSMMAKDCNRFCKIMQPTENKEATPLSVRKQAKKLTFADEAGGLLCHVKVFDQVGSE